MPTRSVSDRSDIIATITFDGVGDTGTVEGETRSVTGFSVTNNATHNGVAVPIFIKVEMETNKARTVEATVGVGQTVSNNNIPAGQRPTITWKTTGPMSPRWDGLNVYFRVPA